MLQGTLGDFPLPDVLRLLSLSRKSGSLSVARADVTGRVDVCDGDVCFAASDVTRMALWSRLVGAGVLSAEHLRGLSDEPGVNLSKLLVESGRLDDDRRNRLVREQIVDAFCEMALWPEGTFSFAAGSPTDLGVRVGVEQLAAEAAQRQEEWAGLRQRVRSRDAVLGMVPHPPEGVIGLDPEQWRLLSLINAQRTVAEVAELSGWSEYTTCKVLAGLVDAGLVEAAVPASGVGLRLGEIVAGQELLRRLEREQVPGPAAAAAPAHQAVQHPPVPAQPQPLPPPQPQPVAEPAPQPPSPLEVAAEEAVVAQPAAPRFVDRSAMARELAALGLGPPPAERPPDDAAPEPPPAPAPAPAPSREPHPEANRGLLSRLMGGRQG